MLTRDYGKSRIRPCKSCGKDCVGKQCMACYCKGKGSTLSRQKSQRRYRR